MEQRPGPRWPKELLSPAAMARADAASPVPVSVLMEAAGRAVARAAMARFRPCRTLVLAGPGNNGGDGYVAARLLEGAGWPVAVAMLAPPRAGGPAAGAAARWRGPVVALRPEEARRAGLVVDALLGAAPTRPLPSEAVATLRAASAVLAVDVPSGLDGATGQPVGEITQAAATVTFARLKPGHLLMPGRLLCGDLVLADIGLPEAALALGIMSEAPAFRNGPDLWRVPIPGAGGHKYDRGHLVVVGDATMGGAARMAASAARRAGAGLVTLAATDASGAALFRAGEPGLIVADPPVEALLDDSRRNAWVIGPGLPPDHGTQGFVARAVAAGRSVVADAGALTAFAGNPDGLRGVAVATPHAGEFGRVFGPVGGDKLAAARRAAARIGGVVLLKGPDTVIAAPDGRAVINHDAPPSLATGGTGDVLAGIIGALLAQGMPAFEAACAGAWLHGRAAPTGPGAIAEDVVRGIPLALAAATLGKPRPLG